MLAQYHLYDNLPVKEQALPPNLVSMDVVWAEALHAKVVDESVLFDVFNVFLDLFVWDFAGYES